MSMRETHLRHGATLAGDGIPLHYADQAHEYDHALRAVVILDRSHQGRIRLTGQKRAEFLNRMSTNKLDNLNAYEGRPTIFTNDNARIIDRVVVYALDDALLLVTEPGRGQAVAQYLQRHIFFGDDVQITDITGQTAMFGLHGPKANEVAATLEADIPQAESLMAKLTSILGQDVTLLKNKPLVDSHWQIVCNTDDAPAVYEHILQIGASVDLSPVGSLTYNVLRIRAGQPAAPEFANAIPLEIGLYDEISFNKGCYTGQEIIARMDSRERIARVLVRLQLSEAQTAPVDILSDGQKIGTLTSCAQAPDGTIYGLGLVKSKAMNGSLSVGESDAKVLGYAGTPPPFLQVDAEHSSS